jgi:hypothetical protein
VGSGDLLEVAFAVDGMALAAIGVCGFLSIGGYYATKYTAIYSFKLMKVIYRGILK